MKKLLLCGFMVLLCVGVSAQTVTVRQTASGTHVSSDQKPNSYIPDSLRQLPSTDRLPADTLRRLAALPSSVQRVYSEKQWNTAADSLLKIPGVNIPNPPQLPPIKDVSEGELVDAVNQKFFPGPKPTLPVTSEQDLAGQVGALDNQALPAMPALPTADLSKLDLSSLARQNLTPLSGSIIKSKYLDALDSVRKVNLRESDLMLDEKKASAEQVIARVRQRPDFFDRSYLEGVIGFSGNSFKVFQIAPAFGYHFTDNLSLGLGPNIMVDARGKNAYTTFGVKTFMKGEFLKRQAYVQVEDIMDNASPAGSAERKNILQQHRVLAGGGYLLTLSAPVTLNFAILYQLTDNKNKMSEFSPWVFRVGISSVKLKK